MDDKHAPNYTLPPLTAPQGRTELPSTSLHPPHSCQHTRPLTHQVWELVASVHGAQLSDPKQAVHQVHIAQVVEEGVRGEHSHAIHLHLTPCGKEQV